MPELTEDTLAEMITAMPREQRHAKREGQTRLTARPILFCGTRAMLRAQRIVRSTPPGPLFGAVELRLAPQSLPDSWELV